MKSWKFYAKFAKKHRKKAWASKKGKPFRKNQRFAKKYGFTYEDAWALDEELICWLLPRIAYLRDNHTAVPFVLEDTDDIEQQDKAWVKILNQMAKGFYLYLKKSDTLETLTHEECEKVDRAFALLKRYHVHLGN